MFVGDVVRITVTPLNAKGNVVSAPHPPVWGPDQGDTLTFDYISPDSLTADFRATAIGEGLIECRINNVTEFISVNVVADGFHHMGFDVSKPGIR